MSGSSSTSLGSELTTPPGGVPAADAAAGAPPPLAEPEEEGMASPELQDHWPPNELSRILVHIFTVQDGLFFNFTQYDDVYELSLGFSPHCWTVCMYVLSAKH